VGWRTTTRLENIWTPDGTEDFLVRHEAEGVLNDARLMVFARNALTSGPGNA
jgi:hypothetical protein